jgi:CarboxypepD_reg-like domain
VKNLFIFSFLWCTFVAGWSQTTLSGTITDDRGEPLPGANVFLEDTYDGATSDATGKYSFTTTETGTKKLTASFLGYESMSVEVELTGGTITQDLKLKEAFTQVNTVVISAGGFGASDDKKSVILNPLDIVTIAGANGDIFGALNYLPGTNPVGEQNGIFVRGGDNSETQTVIDELVVQKPFFSSLPDLPSRGRFNPFTFKGTFFSTGGYSAQYGQAMSSSLILGTTDLADTTSSGVNLMLAGVGGYHTKKWIRSSMAMSLNYTDVALLFLLNKQNAEWEIPPRGISGGLNYRFKNRNGGIWKFYTTYDDNHFVVKFRDSFDPQSTVRTKLHNTNFYSNASYKGLINDKWLLFAGVSGSRNSDLIRLDSNVVDNVDQLYQGKVMLVRSLKNGSSFRFGTEGQFVSLKHSYNEFNTLPLDNEIFSGSFAEVEINFSTKFAARVGGRTEYSSLIGKVNAAPRISLAYKTGKYSQASIATGKFYQTPNREFLVYGSMYYENSSHLILNWQYIKEKRTFRAEAYYKLYDNLAKIGYGIIPGVFYTNDGNGYSRGIDIFWRDQQTFKNGDYWFSYSFLDTKRNYRDFPIEAMPTFAATHTGSFVGKRFIAKLRSQVGISYILSSGRPYYNPNRPNSEYLIDRTPAYHSLNVNWAYITSFQKNFMVIFASLNNVLGRDNIFGYRYSPDGQYSTPITQTTKRAFFVGLFIAFR